MMFYGILFIFRGFIEKIGDYQYANHLNELVVEGMFVRIFNKNISKLTDFPKFLKQLFYEIYARVKCLDENLVFSHKNTNNSRVLKGRIFDVKRLIEALKAVNNVLRNVGLHNIVMEKTNFDIIVRLLEVFIIKFFNFINKFIISSLFLLFFHILHIKDCDKWFFEMKSYLTTLQLEIYSILEQLITNSQETLNIISNKKLIKAFFQQLKSNVRTDNVVIEKILKILCNLSLQGHFYKILGRYGFVFVLFEISLKNEIISKSNRITAFKLLLKLRIDREYENQENFLMCIELFPEEIRQVYF